MQIKYHMRFKEDLGIEANDKGPFVWSIQQALGGSEQEKFLIFLELTIKYIRDSGNSYTDYASDIQDTLTVISYLDDILSHGSIWEIVPDIGDEAGLRERVNRKIVDTAKNLNNDHLTRAWNYAFGRERKPDEAIYELKKAIELAFQPKVCPTQTSGSVYGHVLAAIKDARIETIFQPTIDATYKEHPKQVKPDTKNWLIEILNLIQQLEYKRHATLQNQQTSPKYYELAVQSAVIVGTPLIELIERDFLKIKAK